MEYSAAVEKIQKEFKNIEVEEYYVDNMTQQLVKNPERFNDSVLLSTNLFMDIVSECAPHRRGTSRTRSGSPGAPRPQLPCRHGRERWELRP